MALTADTIASLVDTAFIGQIGSVELAAVGVFIALFNQASRIAIFPLVSINMINVWSLVRRFDQLQKPFISRYVVRGKLEIGSLREVDVKSGLPATTSTERLEVLDDNEHILCIRIIGGDHRLRMSISWTALRIFHNLIHMELRYDHDTLCEENCTWLLGMLQHFPKLQHFIIQNCGNGNIICYNCWKHPLTVPECISSELKTCCIRGYDGTKYEFEFAKYILQHSKVLETMIVTTTCIEKYQMLQELSLCTRGSATCKLVFE